MGKNGGKKRGENGGKWGETDFFWCFFLKNGGKTGGGGESVFFGVFFGIPQGFGFNGDIGGF